MALLLLVQCQEKKKTPTPPKAEPATSINDYNWMLGTWLAHGLEFYEHWEKVDDYTLRGTVYKELNDSSTISEIILFRKTEDGFEYKPTVNNENNGLPITFRSVNAQTNLIQFENMRHDFPNRIVYFKNSEQQLDVKIEGIRDGETFQSYDIMMSKM